MRNFKDTLLLSALIISFSSTLATAKEDYNLNIEPQELSTALRSFAEQTELQVIYFTATAEGKTAPQLNGSYTAEGALEQLLADTGLDYRNVDNRTYSIAAANKQVVSSEAESGFEAQPLSPIITAQLEAEPEASDNRSDDQESETKELDDLVVTGTRLRNLNAESMSKQVIILSAEDLANTGEVTLEAALRRVPQNFGGLSESTGAFSSLSLPGADHSANGAVELSGASTINLRGIATGSRSTGTLILIDGRRLTDSGAQGGVFDISSIPMNRVERVEIVLDGASAIYGSDAIGGVVNIITKKEDTFSVYGSYFDSVDKFGDLGEWQSGFSAGHVWDSGNISYGLSTKQTSLTLGRDIDYRWLNTREYSLTTGELAPVEVGRFGNTAPPSLYVDLSDPATYLHQINNNYNPTPADFAPGRAPDSIRFSDDESINPEISQFNADVTVNQTLSDTTELTAGLLYMQRDTTTSHGAVGASTAVTLFDTPHRAWGLYPEFGIPMSKTKLRNLELFGEIDIELSDAWSLSVNASHSENKNRNRTENPVLSRADELTGWNPWGDGLANANIPYVDDIDGPGGPLQPGEWMDSSGTIYTGSILDFLQQEGPWSRTDNKQSIVGLSVNGDLIDLPGGNVQFAGGVEYRETSFDIESYAPDNAGLPPFISYDELNLSSEFTAAYGEIFVPIFGANNARTGLYSLSLQGSVRYEESTHKGEGIAAPGSFTGSEPVEPAGNTYDATTYSIGAVWSPMERLSLKANFNTSFKAPELRDLWDSTARIDFTAARCALFSSRLGGPPGWCINPGDFGSHPDPAEWWQPDPFVIVQSGNPGLDPERSENTTFTAEVRPMDNLTLSASWSRREFLDRAIYGGGTVTNLLAGTAHEVIPDSFEFTGVEDYVAVWYQRPVNVDTNVQEGYDFKANWNVYTDYGFLGFTANWTTTTRDRTEFAGNITDLVGIRAPKSSGRININWSRNNWFAAIDASYRGSVVDSRWHERGETGIKSERSMRANATVSYSFAETDNFLANSQLSLTVNNIFDQVTRQNFYFEGAKVGRISATSPQDPRNRSISLSLRKEF